MLVILRQGCEVSVKEVDGLLSMLANKKRKIEQEEAESSMQIMREFLHCLRQRKLDELHEVFEFRFALFVLQCECHCIVECMLNYAFEVDRQFMVKCNFDGIYLLSNTETCFGW